VSSDETISASALYGTPEAMRGKLETLRAGGAAYILVNAPPRAGLRASPQEVRRRFADAQTLQPA